MYFDRRGIRCGVADGCVVMVLLFFSFCCYCCSLLVIIVILFLLLLLFSSCYCFCCCSLVIIVVVLVLLLLLFYSCYFRCFGLFIIDALVQLLWSCYYCCCSSGHATGTSIRMVLSVSSWYTLYFFLLTLFQKTFFFNRILSYAIFFAIFIIIIAITAIILTFTPSRILFSSSPHQHFPNEVVKETHGSLACVCARVTRRCMYVRHPFQRTLRCVF